jgi:hypothetical protein
MLTPEEVEELFVRAATIVDRCGQRCGKDAIWYLKHYVVGDFTVLRVYDHHSDNYAIELRATRPNMIYQVATVNFVDGRPVIKHMVYMIEHLAEYGIRVLAELRRAMLLDDLANA